MKYGGPILGGVLTMIGYVIGLVICGLFFRWTGLDFPKFW